MAGAIVTDLAWTLAGFVGCTALILLSGVRLSRYGDIIAKKTGLGGTWIGVVLLAAVTSLPELITGASAIAIFEANDIAAGDAIGSCMFNLVILAFLDFRHPAPLSASIHQGHVLAAAFGLVQLGLAGLAVLAGPSGPVVGWIGVQSVLFLGVYVFAVRTIFVYERRRHAELAEELTGEIRYGGVTLRRAAALYAANAAVLVVAAAVLPGVGERLAAETGLNRSFVGSLFVAASTSMPEVVVSVAAARMGAIDMAAGNLFGSNLFNVAVLGIDDVIYTGGSFLAVVSRQHLVTLTSASVMTAIAIIGLTYRAQKKRFRLSWDAIAIVAVYLTGTLLLARLG
jgi:cation:H+ antiporter